jgi:hypothetical protein
MTVCEDSQQREGARPRKHTRCAAVDESTPDAQPWTRARPMRSRRREHARCAAVDESTPDAQQWTRARPMRSSGREHARCAAVDESTPDAQPWTHTCNATTSEADAGAATTTVAYTPHRWATDDADPPPPLPLPPSTSTPVSWSCRSAVADGCRGRWRCNRRATRGRAVHCRRHQPVLSGWRCGGARRTPRVRPASSHPHPAATAAASAHSLCSSATPRERPPEAPAQVGRCQPPARRAGALRCTPSPPECGLRRPAAATPPAARRGHAAAEKPRRQSGDSGQRRCAKAGRPGPTRMCAAAAWHRAMARAPVAPATTHAPSEARRQETAAPAQRRQRQPAAACCGMGATQVPRRSAADPT